MIHIGEYRIHKMDERNWVVEKKRIIQEGKDKGDEAWGSRKFYAKLQYAAHSLLDKMVANADATSVKRLVREIRKAKNEITEAVLASGGS